MGRFVFVTGMLVQTHALHRIVDMCKAHGKIVAAGGPYVLTTTEAQSEATPAQVDPMAEAGDPLD